MAIHWRDLLDHLQVPWIDHGRNVRRGEIAIRCPWCGDDPSKHLDINEASGAYRCLRNPQHRGRSPYWLLKGLGQSGDLSGLITAFGGAARGLVTETRQRPEQPTLTRRWQRLHPASSDPDTLDYLERRGFTNPRQTADTFDLRVGSNTMARRCWFKLCDLNGQVVGFTGRAIDNWRTPKYYTEATDMGLYMPRQPANSHRLALLVEGPMDALKVADATSRRSNLFIAALCGLSVTGHKRLQLAEIAKTVPNFIVALDRSIWASSGICYNVIAELRTIPSLAKISRFRMPEDTDDPGDMTNSGVERWLTTDVAAVLAGMYADESKRQRLEWQAKRRADRYDR